MTQDTNNTNETVHPAAIFAGCFAFVACGAAGIAAIELAPFPYQALSLIAFCGPGEACAFCTGAAFNRMIQAALCQRYGLNSAETRLLTAVPNGQPSLTSAIQ